MSCASKSAAFLLISLLPAALMAQGTARRVATYRISGTVLDGLARCPVGRARVAIVQAERGRQVTLMTGTDGRFNFESLPAGKWSLTANRNGFLPAQYGQRPVPNSPGSAVFTGPGQTSEDLVLDIYPQAVISGKVVDENGEPAKNVLVQLYRSGILGGRRRTASVNRSWTNELGEYRFWRLQPGSYYLSATGWPWFNTTRGDPADDRSNVNSFEPQYYPNASDARSASPLVVKAGEEVTADFTLRLVRGVTVSISGVKGSHRLALTSEGLPGCDLVHRVIGAGHAPSFGGILPGSYKLVVYDLAAGVAPRIQRIEVGTEDLDLPLALPDLVTAEAYFRVENGFSEDLRKVTAMLMNEDQKLYVPRKITAGSPVAFEGLTQGQFRLMVFGESSCYLANVAAEGTRVVGTLIDIPERGPVRLQAAVRCDGGHVKGKVHTGEHPLVGALVVLAPKTDSGDATDYKLFQTDGDGSFDYEGVRPGEWLIFATLDDDLEYANPAAIRGYLEAAHPLRVAANGSYDLQLEPTNLTATQR